MIVELREVRPGDAEAVFATLRARDVGRISLPEVKEAADSSIYALVGTIDGRPAVMCAARLASILDDRAYIWLLGTSLIDRYPIVFLRHSRRMLALLTARFPCIYGQVECDFAASERWLRWLGCDFLTDDGQTKVFRWVSRQ